MAWVCQDLLSVVHEGVGVGEKAEGLPGGRKIAHPFFFSSFKVQQYPGTTGRTRTSVDTRLACSHTDGAAKATCLLTTAIGGV